MLGDLALTKQIDRQKDRQIDKTDRQKQDGWMDGSENETKRNVESTYAAYCVCDMEGGKKEQNGPVVRMSYFFIVSCHVMF